jgi:hypothetical protein
MSPEHNAANLPQTAASLTRGPLLKENPKVFNQQET